MILKKRIEEIDIYKGILIVLVVIGHATNYLNIYIYQFHMAAFFFISGFLSTIEKDGFIKFIYKKFMSLKLPLFTVFILMQIFIAILYHSGNYNIFFDDNLQYYGFVFNFKEFIFHDRIYLWFLGAAWFITVLFYIEVLKKIIYDLFNKNEIVPFMISVVMFLLGYFFILNKINFLNIDLVLIGQFYYSLGFYSSKQEYIKKRVNNSYICIILFTVSLLLVFFLSKITGITVDYPSRNFGNPLVNLFTAINGIVCIYTLSLIFKKNNLIKKIFSYLGKNTLPILFFHFMFFKVSFFVLYSFRVVNASYFKNFLPTEEIYKFTPIIVIISILCCLCLWRILISLKILKLLLGEDKDIVYRIYDILLYKYPFISKFEINIFNNKTINKFSQKIKNYFKLLEIRLIFLFCILISMPIVRQYVINHDELVQRYASLDGFISSFKYGISNEIRMGRPTRILAAFNTSMSFIFRNIFISRTIQCLLILLSVFLLSYFMKLMTKNKYYPFFIFITTLLFIPITFEHCPPNAFNGLVLIPLIELLSSFIVYKKYFLENKKFIYLFISVVLFFVASLGYEFVILYVFLYPIIYYQHIKKFNVKNILKNIYVFIFACIVYCVVYFVGKRVFIQNYEGVQFGFVSIKSSAKIIYTLIKTSFPGYYLFNEKYRWILNFFIKGENFFLFKNMIFIRIIILFIVIYKIFSMWLVKFQSTNLNKNTLYIILPIIYLFLVSIPNSISKIYQGNVDDTNFTGLPVTYFMYFSMMISLTYFCYFYILSKLNKGKKTIIFLLIIPALAVQFSNDVFSVEQNMNFERILNIEKLFDTNALRDFNNNNISSTDFFKTSNALFIDEDYWNNFSKRKNLNINFLNNDLEKIKIFELSRGVYSFVVDNEVRILSEYRLRGIIPIRVSSTKYIKGNFETENFIDNGFFSYNFLIKDSQELEESKNELFKDINIGNSLEKLTIEGDYFNDGFIGKNISFSIRTGNKGEIYIYGYYPNKIKVNENINVIIGDKNHKLYIKSNDFSFEFQVEKNKVEKVEIISNFTFKPKEPDIRVLSFIIKNIYSE